MTCNSYRNPELLADMARTVDHISGGRLHPRASAPAGSSGTTTEYGYDFGTAGSRLADLAAALPRIKARWARLNPAADPAIPVLIGGGGERKTLRYTAEHAQIWHAFGDVDVAPAQERRAGPRTARTSGRDPAEIERSIGVGRALPAGRGRRLVAAGADAVHRRASTGRDFTFGQAKQWVPWRDAAELSIRGGRDQRRPAALPDRPTAGPDLLLGHMGGPFFARKDDGAWSIPKGLLDPDEDPFAGAVREFTEELGSPPPDGPAVPLGSARGRGKTITVFAVAGEFDAELDHQQRVHAGVAAAGPGGCSRSPRSTGRPGSTPRRPGASCPQHR